MADHDALRHAWSRYGALDAASVDHQKRFLRSRRAILIVGVLAAAAGLVSVAVGDAARDAPHSVWPVIHRPLEWVTRVAALALAGLFAVAARLDRGEPWVLSRRAAELVLREIFLYRTGRGPYKVAGGALAKLDGILATQLRALSHDALPPFDLATAGKFQPRIARTSSGQPIVLAGEAVDDGLHALAADDYARIRIADQVTWYASKARRARSALRGYQTAGILVGLAGAALAFAGGPWIAWVAVATAVAAALTSWTELRRLEPTAAAYERSAVQLDDLRLWWETLPEAEQALEDNFDRLVTEAEAVIESENASWTQDMRKRIAELRAEAEQRATAAKPK